MGVKVNRKFPYTFKSVYKNYSVTINGKTIKFNNHIFETEDEELAMALRKKSKEGNYFKEIPIVELYKQAKKKENNQEPKTIEEAIEKVVEKKKKMYPCPVCGEEFGKTIDLEKHKVMKHPEEFLLKKARAYIKERDEKLLRGFSKKKKKKVGKHKTNKIL